MTSLAHRYGVRARRLNWVRILVSAMGMMTSSAQQQHDRTADGWCGHPPAWRDGPYSTTSEQLTREEALTLLLAVHGDVRDGVRRGCVDKGSVNFDPAATLDDGSCRATFREGDACLIALADAWDACTQLGDACSDSCYSASRTANESLAVDSCAEAVHISGRSFTELLADLNSAVESVDCTPPAVVVSLVAMTTVGGTVAMATFQAAVAAALGGNVEPQDVVVEAFEQTATAAVILQGSTSDFDESTPVGQAARDQFTNAIASLYMADVRTSTACPGAFPYASATYSNVICYDDASWALAGSGPCNSWCTKDVDFGSGCGHNSNHLCNATAMSVTVTITGVTVEPGSGDAGRRLSEGSESWSEDTDNEQIFVEYAVSSTTELDTAAADFDGVALSAALRDIGGSLGPFEPDSLVPLSATFTTVVEYAVAVEANSLAEAEAVGEVASAAMQEVAICLGGPNNCLSITTSAVQQARCGDGHELHPSQLDCVPCPEATAGIGECIACGAGKEPDRRRARCIPCTGNFSSLAGTCELCPPGTIASNDHVRCIAMDPVAHSTEATRNNQPLQDLLAQQAPPACIVIPIVLLSVHVAAATWITAYWLFGARCIATTVIHRSCRGVVHWRSAAYFSVSAMSSAVIDILLTCVSNCTVAQHLLPAVGAVLCCIPIPYLLHRSLHTNLPVDSLHHARDPDLMTVRRPATPPKVRPSVESGSIPRVLPVPRITTKLSAHGVPRPLPRPNRKAGATALDFTGTGAALSLDVRLRGGELPTRETAMGRQTQGYDLRALTVVNPPDESIDLLEAPEMPRLVPGDGVELWLRDGYPSHQIGQGTRNDAPSIPRRPIHRGYTESPVPGNELVATHEESASTGDKRVPQPPKRPPIQPQPGRGQRRNLRMFINTEGVDQLPSPGRSSDVARAVREGNRTAVDNGSKNSSSSSSSSSSSDDNSDDSSSSDSDSTSDTESNSQADDNDGIRQAEHCDVPTTLDTLTPSVAAPAGRPAPLRPAASVDAKATMGSATLLWGCTGIGCWRWLTSLALNECWSWGTIVSWLVSVQLTILVSYCVQPGGSPRVACDGTGRRYSGSGDVLMQPASPSTPRVAFV